MIRRLIILLTLSLSISYASAQALEIGQPAPEIIQNSPNGKAISLSSLRGQMVLIDFWASWCGPCRKENPALVASYQKYHNTEFKNGNGFTIYSVSLDQKQEAWKMAIATDSLIWKNHVSDLKGWRNEAAKRYNVKAIPINYLIDGDGVIVAINLRGDELEAKLRKLQKKSWFSFIGSGDE